MTKRKSVFIVLNIVLFLIVWFRLFSLQVVAGDYYSELSERKLYRATAVTASRGEIYDRYGRPIVQNRMAFAIKIDKAGLKGQDANEIYLKLINIMEQQKSAYIDTLPISSAPYKLLYSDAATKQSFEAFLKTSGYGGTADARDIMDFLCDRYGVNKSRDEISKRKLCGINYEMEQREFSLYNPFTLSNDADISLVSRIKERYTEFPGVDISVEPVREYANEGYASHIIGRIGPIFKEEYDQYKDNGYKMSDLVGKDGIEKTMEEWLHGTDGVMGVETDNLGRIVRQFFVKDPIPGKNIMLTIDMRLQKAVEDTLSQTIKKLAEKARTTGKGDPDINTGAAVVLDVRTGEVLALASYPTFNLNNFFTNYQSLISDPSKPMFNRAISGTYAPGSAFKMVTSVAALESGAITPDTKITCKGTYMFYAPSYTPKCLGVHGAINIVEALRVSCNYFFYETGRLTGIDKIEEYGKKFGFGELTGIELPGEAKGSLAGLEYTTSKGIRWNRGDTLQAAIGQSYTLSTPIQLASYTATLANNGYVLTPHLLKSVKSYDYNNTIYDTPVSQKTYIQMKDSTIAKIREGMAAVAKTGTAASYFRNYPVSVAAKTGTAQTGSVSTNGVFLAYAPVENPEIAVAVVIEGAGSGGSTAPVAKAIFDEYFSPSRTNTGTFKPENELVN